MAEFDFVGSDEYHLIQSIDDSLFLLQQHTDKLSKLIDRRFSTFEARQALTVVENQIRMAFKHNLLPIQNKK